MSTHFHALDPLFSSVRVETNPVHTKVTLFVRGQNIGTLCVSQGDGESLLNLIFTVRDSVDVCGLPLGVTDIAHPAYMEDSAQLLSEHGEVTTLGALRQKQNQETV